MGRICDFTKKKKQINYILKKGTHCFIFSDGTLQNIHTFSHEISMKLYTEMQFFVILMYWNLKRYVCMLLRNI